MIFFFFFSYFCKVIKLSNMKIIHLLKETTIIEVNNKSMHGCYAAAFHDSFLSLYLTIESIYSKNSKIKRILWIFFFILLNIPYLHSQIIERPSVSSQNVLYTYIQSVSLNRDGTCVAIFVNHNKIESFKFSRLTSLTTNNGNKLQLKNFSIGNGWLKFDKSFHISTKRHIIYLYFDKIDPTTTSIDIVEKDGKYWKGISLKRAEPKTTTNTTSSSNNRNSFSDGYNSAQQIRNYLASRITTLDPIEGEYDVDFSGEYITPFVHQYLDRDNFKMWIVRNNSSFTIYTNNEGFKKSRYLKIQSIGETNAYTFYYDSTPTRIYLQNLNHFKASLHLNNSSASTFRGTATAASVNILPVYDCIKVYPTMSMYADVFRNNYEEEAKPNLWTGTGFALKDNYVVTNYHVVEDAKTISIQGINGNFSSKYTATIVASDKNNDLAILKMNGTNISSASIPYAVKTSTSEVGEDVFVLGYPLTSTMGDEIKLTTGVISSKTGFQGDVSLYQISAPIQPGNSGGPLFDGKGNIIGIVSAKHKGAENVGYAIKASYLNNLIESTVSSNILPQTNKISNLNLSGKVKSVKNYVYYIVCSR